MSSMTSGPVGRRLIGYAVPLILGNFFQLAYNAVDAVVIGKCAGQTALAAVSAANPVMNVVILGVSGMSIGASVLMSRFYGAGDETTLRRELATTLIFGAVASVVVFVIGLLLGAPVLRLMNVPQEALTQAITYLRVIFVGFLFTFLYNILAAALRSVGDSKTPVLFLALASVLNAVLDVVFVALLGLGVTGAGLATVLAEGVSALLCARHIASHIPLLRLGRADWRIDCELLTQTVKSGAVTALQQACQPVGKALIQSVINAQGVAVIAAFNAVSRVDDFACIPQQSISSAMMTCIAQNRGAGKDERVRETFRKGMGIELSYGVLICTLTLLAREPVMRLFAAKDGQRMVALGTQYLSLMAVFYILPGITNGMQGFFRGMGHMKTTLAGTLMQISIRTAAVYLLVPRMGLTGAAWACALGWCAMIGYEVLRWRQITGEEWK